jgi:hypothetical protein
MWPARPAATWRSTKPCCSKLECGFGSSGTCSMSRSRMRSGPVFKTGRAGQPPAWKVRFLRRVAKGFPGIGADSTIGASCHGAARRRPTQANLGPVIPPAIPPSIPPVCVVALCSGSSALKAAPFGAAPALRYGVPIGRNPSLMPPEH